MASHPFRRVFCAPQRERDDPARRGLAEEQHGCNTVFCGVERREHGGNPAIFGLATPRSDVFPVILRVPSLFRLAFSERKALIIASNVRTRRVLFLSYSLARRKH